MNYNKQRSNELLDALEFGIDTSDRRQEALLAAQVHALLVQAEAIEELAAAVQDLKYIGMETPPMIEANEPMRNHIDIEELAAAVQRINQALRDIDDE